MAGGSAKREGERPQAPRCAAAGFLGDAELAGLQGLNSRPMARIACIPASPIMGGGFALNWGALGVSQGALGVFQPSIRRILDRLDGISLRSACISLCFIWRFPCPHQGSLLTLSPCSAPFVTLALPPLSLVLTLAGRHGIFRAQKKLRVHQCSR